MLAAGSSGGHSGDSFSGFRLADRRGRHHANRERGPSQKTAAGRSKEECGRLMTA